MAAGFAVGVISILGGAPESNVVMAAILVSGLVDLGLRFYTLFRLRDTLALMRNLVHSEYDADKEAFIRICTEQGFPHELEEDNFPMNFFSSRMGGNIWFIPIWILSGIGFVLYLVFRK